jgi:hypothetical protein
MNLRSALGVLFAAFSVFPWGKVGHETIGYIAQDRLSTKTIEKLRPLLQEENLASISSWADDIKKERNQTNSWHYINLPIREDISGWNLFNYSRKKDNIIYQIKKDIADLKSANKRKGDTTASGQNQLETLKFLVHFIGDAHDPLHCSSDKDGQGTQKWVWYCPPDFQKRYSTTLHSLWDDLLEIKTTADPKLLSKQINKEFSDSAKKTWAADSIDDWILKSYTIAKRRIYSDLPQGPSSKIILPKYYYLDMRPLVDEQLEKAGIRLSRILNEIYGK